MGFITGNVYMNIFGVLVAILAITVTYFRWSFGYWNRRNIPTPPTSFPFGNAANVFLQRASFGADLMETYFNMKAKGLKFCGYYFFTKPTLMILDPDLVKTITTKDFIHFTDHGGYVNEKVDPLSGHLFNIKGLKWKNLRAKLTPTFTSGKMKMMFQTLLSCSGELLTVMDEAVHCKESFNVKEIVGRFSTDVIGSCAFGIECNSLKNPNSQFRQYGKKVFELGAVESIKILVASIYPEIANFFKVPINNPAVTKFFMNAVKETVKYREENNIVRKDFMHLLIQLKNNVKITDEDKIGELIASDETVNESEPGKTLTVEELAAQAFVFFIGGFETSSTTLTFCFYEFVSNLDIQNKLREEITEVLERHDGNFTYNAMMEMTYMDKCIKETLRKYPPLPFLTRECTQPYKLPDSNLTLDKGAGVMVPIMGIHRDPDYYPDPEKFDPERFSPENKSKRHPYTWLPFGDGPRSCIGLRFGVMQTKVALTVLLKKYKFTLSSKTQLPLVMEPKSAILTAQGGVWLNAERVA